MQLGDKKASAALLEHLQHMVCTEPDRVWSYLRPPGVRPKNFTERLRTWADSIDWDEDDERKTPRRPAIPRLLLDMRLGYLDMLDAYEQMKAAHPKFPLSIYTKPQVNKARSLAQTAADLFMEENSRLIQSMVGQMPYRKHAVITSINTGGLPHSTAIKALVYWCLTQPPVP